MFLILRSGPRFLRGKVWRLICLLKSCMDSKLLINKAPDPKIAWRGVCDFEDSELIGFFYNYLDRITLCS
jgi:hypothetical protein